MKTTLLIGLLSAALLPRLSAATFTVTSLKSGGIGTLREAIDAANANPGPDVIAFNLAGAGVKKITLSSSAPLPDITDPVTIDATTQPGYAGTPLVELDCAQNDQTSGLTITAGHSVVRGLAIGNKGSFASANLMYGIALLGGGTNKIEGCYLGVKATGTNKFGNIGNASGGVLISNSVANVIGGLTAAARNVIAGNAGNGVVIGGAGASNNVVLGNYIGLGSDGVTLLSHSGSAGVLVTSGAAGNTIGGVEPGSRNVITEVSIDCILIQNGATGTRVWGNYLGLRADGSSRLPVGNLSFGAGVRVFEAPGNNVGGTADGEGNVIGGNDLGIGIIGAASAGTRVQGNFIGTDPTGTTAIPNGPGVFVRARDCLIGGSAAGAGNLISGNLNHGVNVSADADGSRVQGNFIGTDVTGRLALGNGRTGTDAAGVAVSSADILIGGGEPGAGNLISGNKSRGVQFINTTAVNDRLQGNFIGLDLTGTNALGNASDGVQLLGAARLIIGGTNVGEGNVIAANGGAGIRLSATFGGFGLASSNNLIVGNVLGLALPPSVAGAGPARVARPAAPRLAGPPLAGTVKAPQVLSAVEKAIQEGFIQKSPTPLRLDALGAIRNEVGENTCIGVLNVAPANLIGAGPGKPGLNALAGKGILNAGNNYFVLGPGTAVQFASGVNSAAARPVITSAIQTAPRTFHIKGRAGGGKKGDVILVEFLSKFTGFPNDDGTVTSISSSIGFVTGVADASGNFDFDVPLNLPPDSGFGLPTPTNVVAKATHGKSTSRESDPQKVEVLPSIPPPIRLSLGSSGGFNLGFDAPGGTVFNLQAAPTPAGPWNTRTNACGRGARRRSGRTGPAWCGSARGRWLSGRPGPDPGFSRRWSTRPRPAPKTRDGHSSRAQSSHRRRLTGVARWRRPPRSEYRHSRSREGRLPV